jgi:hypothetical protein
LHMLKDRFFDEIFKYLSDIAIDSSTTLSLYDVYRYMETLKQNWKSITYLLNELRDNDFQLHFEEDILNYHTNGAIYIHLHPKDSADPFFTKDYHYEMRLLEESRSWGYCQCSPTDEGYCAEHDCCGVNCDWYVPAISITKISPTSDFYFEGTEKDLWDAEKSWKDAMNVHENNKRKELIEKIDQEISELKKRRSLLTLD